MRGGMTCPVGDDGITCAVGNEMPDGMKSRTFLCKISGCVLQNATILIQLANFGFTTNLLHLRVLVRLPAEPDQKTFF